MNLTLRQSLTKTLTQSLGNGVKRVSYSGPQIARILWYTGHYAVGRRRMGPLTNPGEAPYAEQSEPLDRRRLTEAFNQLFKKDWGYIRDGVYKMPLEVRGSLNPGKLWRESRDYLRDSERVARRKAARHHSEVLNEKTREKFPRYFLQNFHFQTDGWMSADSAERYEMQVETLFTGSAGAMRRMALPFVREALNECSGADHKMLDIGCGTAPILREVKRNWPELAVTGLDLSPAYIGKARKILGGESKVDFVQAAAEDTGLSDECYDIVSAVYLFHELPPKVRIEVLQEVARLLKPGGMFILTDTIQYRDEPGLDILLENFPRGFHEPYYDSFCKLDLAKLGDENGLKFIGDNIGFLTKTTAFRKLS